MDVKSVIKQLVESKFTVPLTLKREEVAAIIRALDETDADINDEIEDVENDNFLMTFTAVYVLLINLRKNDSSLKEPLVDFLDDVLKPTNAFKSNVVNAAIALFFMRKTGRLGRLVTKNLLCMYLSNEIVMEKTPWEFVNTEANTSLAVKNYKCHWDAEEGTEYLRLIFALIKISDITRDKQLVLLADDIHTQTYYKIVDMIKDKGYGFVVFSPLVDTFMKYQVAEMRKADELQYLQKSYELNPSASIDSMKRKIPAISPVTGKKIEEETNIPYYEPDREYQVYMEQLNPQKLKYESVYIGDKLYNIMTYNGCLFDVFNPEFATLTWEERLAAVPYHRVKIVVKKMTGKELLAYKPSKAQVIYISCLGPNKLSVTQSAVFRPVRRFVKKAAKSSIKEEISDESMEVTQL